MCKRCICSPYQLIKKVKKKLFNLSVGVLYTLKQNTICGEYVRPTIRQIMTEYQWLNDLPDFHEVLSSKSDFRKNRLNNTYPLVKVINYIFTLLSKLTDLGAIRYKTCPYNPAEHF
jgi:hypothetical protein